MSSFFKKPSWAIKDTANTTPEFYRRSEQTYSDIVAATREAHQKPKASASPEDAQDTENKKDTERKKRPRLSDGNEKKSNNSDLMRHTTSDADSEKSVLAEPSKLLSDSHDSSPESFNQYETSQRGGLESSPSVSLQKAKSPEIQNPPPVQPPTVQADGLATRSPRPVQPPTAPANDPVVQIIISSEIPNTKPLLVHRKLSQSLREVRLAWCNRQKFEPELQSSVYLTWKGRRLFDVTTCRSLGIKAGGNSSSVLNIDDDVADQKELRIHIEAVTDSPILLNRHAASPDTEKPPAVLQPPEDDQGEPMKLVLRSPGFDDFRIKARQKTLISRLISAFRDKHNISADREISLEFDGDTLDPGQNLGHYDIDDLDLVDVQIR
ncbi:hypothetical protein N7475_006434 [Penicillium sp. IBT 31633x]|nr:hypothetical protein N7475_006434 [Penicillium sp. IBT 31633x]